MLNYVTIYAQHRYSNKHMSCNIGSLKDATDIRKALDADGWIASVKMGSKIIIDENGKHL